MITPSNLYAEKIFSEHPIAMWALDDAVDFVSLFSKDLQSMYGWTIQKKADESDAGLKEVVIPSGIGVMIEDSPTIKITSLSTDQLTIKSPSLIKASSLDPTKETVNIGFYFNPATDKMTSVRVGLNYAEEPIVWETFSSFIENEWVFLNKTFSIPKLAGEFVDNELKITIEINTQSGSGGNKDFFINGLSFGQWSEAFHTKSVGVLPTSIPTNIALPTTLKAVSATAYGTLKNSGYYISTDRRLYATNEGFPLVYGASNLTKVINNTSNIPSLIIPGFGFMNDSGRYKEYSFEVWIRISPKTQDPRRIFGPIGKINNQYSLDGLYVDGGFLTLKIGDIVGSHYVGEWGRPMLLHIRLSGNTASVLINGEEVISIDVDMSSVPLPLRSVTTDNVEKSQDWLGFYTYTDLSLLEIDCPAIYSYQVPEVVAKRRFVYGQGVEYPDGINASFSGSSAIIDYKVAGYANNYMYPDIGRWGQGISENMLVENNTLAVPDYQPPSVVFNDSSVTTEAWLEECEIANASQTQNFVDLSLASNIQTDRTRSGGYMLFNNLNILKQGTRGFYGVFRTGNTARQTLFFIESQNDKSYLWVTAEDGDIIYRFNNGVEDKLTITVNKNIPINTNFVVGIDIDEFANSQGSIVKKFFGNSSKLSLYVGGKKDFETTFGGRIYKVGFSTARNLLSLPGTVAEDGTIVASSTETELVGGVSKNILESFFAYNASYTLNPKFYLGDFRLDIAADSYWQDYVPLSYFSKVMTNREGDQESVVDYLQLNIDIPKISIFDGSVYDTSEADVRSYISFQTLSSGANRSSSSFANTARMPSNGVITPNAAEWLNTKYEFVNNAVVYLPTDISFKEIALVVHIEVKPSGITSHRARVRSLQIASQSLNETAPTVISSKFGIKLTPFTEFGVYEDYKYKNPLSIYKSGTPYLYLTESSGIRLRGDFGSDFRGIRVAVNQQQSLSYNVGAIKLLAKYDDPSFSSTPREVARIVSATKSISIMVVADNSEAKRGKVYPVNTKTGLPAQGVALYLNGVAVKDLYIRTEEWNMIGLQFTNALNFNGYAGSIILTGPMLYNNVSNYLLSDQKSAQTYIFRSWGQAKTMDLASIADRVDNPETPENESYNTWKDFIDSKPVISWENILYIPAKKTYLVDPVAIYRTYTGTNKIIVEDNNTLRFNNYQYRMIKDVEWETRILPAV